MTHSPHPRISIIAAIGKNRELGKNNELIWRISPDLKRVKALTTGHPIIMGRKTYESIGYPLPNRTTIVVSNTVHQLAGCMVAPSLQEAIEKASEIDREEVFIFGGARIYHASIDFAHRLYLTVIDDTDVHADAYFPEYTMFTKEIAHEEHPEHIPSFRWITLER